jgi:hypothetical protein
MYAVNHKSSKVGFRLNEQYVTCSMPVLQVVNKTVLLRVACCMCRMLQDIGVALQ